METRKVKAVSASRNDGNAYTYRTSQFKELEFSPGDRYIFKYKNGEQITMKASRKGDTLYSGKTEHNQPIPSIGNPVLHEVVDVFKQLKTWTK